jgi:hypothetical protein
MASHMLRISRALHSSHPRVLCHGVHDRSRVTPASMWRFAHGPCEATQLPADPALACGSGNAQIVEIRLWGTGNCKLAVTRMICEWKSGVLYVSKSNNLFMTSGQLPSGVTNHCALENRVMLLVATTCRHDRRCPEALRGACQCLLSEPQVRCMGGTLRPENSRRRDEFL